MPSIENQSLVFRFPEIHPDAILTVRFHRTLRIPDDNGSYPLPPGLGAFPLDHVDDHSSRAPAEWLRRGGVVMPMWQSEAMWMSFETNRGYPFAVKVAAGKINAVSGETWNETLAGRPVGACRETSAETLFEEKMAWASGTRLHGDSPAPDYMTVPTQPWLDGFHVDAEHIRQFVAMPLGSGYSAEEQITGKAEFGGVQIAVWPMRAAEAEKHIVRPVLRGRCLSKGMPDDLEGSMLIGSAGGASFGGSMGLAAGGMMRQRVHADPYVSGCWETTAMERCFVHLANSETYAAVTGKEPPTKPFGPSEYASRGFPWFEHYSDAPALSGSEKLRRLDSVAALGIKKGEKPLQDNAPVAIPPKDVHKVGPKASCSGGVRDGKW